MRKNIKICVINSNKTLYIVALFMQKNILRFSQTFLQKVIAISQIICYNSRARVEKGVFCPFLTSTICDEVVGGCTQMQGITMEYV